MPSALLNVTVPQTAVWVLVQTLRGADYDWNLAHLSFSQFVCMELVEILCAVGGVCGDERGLG